LAASLRQTITFGVGWLPFQNFRNKLNDISQYILASTTYPWVSLDGWKALEAQKFLVNYLRATLCQEVEGMFLYIILPIDKGSDFLIDFLIFVAFDLWYTLKKCVLPDWHGEGFINNSFLFFLDYMHCCFGGEIP
ncbi:hypothetical protein ACJX0J_039760, partial [Zea mays]